MKDTHHFFNSMLNLIEKLKEVKDFRKNQGKRHPLWLVLFLVIIGMMQGHLGYRALGDFAKSNIKQISLTWGITPSRVPSYSTIRRVIENVDSSDLLLIFNEWAACEYGENIPTSCLAVDGKILKNTLINPHNKEQNFVKFVSLFSQETGIVFNLKKFDNKNGSEIASVQDIIRNCQFKNKVFTGDSLQCQRETIRAVVESNNHYVIAVKKNQPNLYNHLKTISENEKKLSVATEYDTSHGRKIKREVSIYEFTGNNKKEWESISSVIRVTRSGERGTKTYKEDVYYISDIQKNAQEFSKIIRGHWGIENKLHWVKDVIFKEDKSQIKNFNAASNMSIIVTIGMNLYRSWGFLSITEGQRWLANKWDRLMIFLT